MYYFVTRHDGAITWACQEGLIPKGQPFLGIVHLTKDILETLEPGDAVVGVLPIQLVAKVCEKGAKFFALVLDLPLDARGKELTADDMRRYGARLEEYSAKREG